MVVGRPLGEVFACLADPARLGTWLLHRTDGDRSAPAGPPPAGPEDAVFVVRLADVDLLGEVIADEPPHRVAFRLTAPGSSHVLRISCAAEGRGATRVRVHQSAAEELPIDLPALHDLLG